MTPLYPMWLVWVIAMFSASLGFYIARLIYRNESDRADRVRKQSAEAIQRASRTWFMRGWHGCKAEHFGNGTKEMP